MDTVAVSRSTMAKKNSTHLAARCNEELSKRIQEWCQANGMSQSQLIVRAVEKYISEDQTLKAVTASDEDVMNAAETVMKDHEYTLEKLK